MASDQPLDFEQLLEEYGDSLKRVAATYEANLTKQQDLFQEISLAVWLAIPAFKHNSSFKTYMLRIAHNVSVKHVAKEIKSRSYTELAEQNVSISQSVDVDTCLEKHQQAERLMHHVRQLPLKHRQLFALLMEGLSYKEIADTTGISVANVGMLIMRIKEKLTEAMSNE